MPDEHDRLRQRIDDLSRALDESPAAGTNTKVQAELDEAIARLRSLEAMNDRERLVQEFCDAWSRRDIDELLTYFADDAVYHNIPLEPAQGHEAIRGVMEFFLPMSQAVSFEMLQIGSNDDVVFTERVDRFTMGDKQVDLPVAGVFEIRDGKIAAWRDYFDLQTWINQTSG